MIVGLDHAQIPAPAGCEEAARAFFGGLLGLPEIAKPAVLAPRGGVWFSLADGRELHVGVEKDFAPQTKAHVGLLVRGLGELRTLAERFDASIDGETIPGAHRCYVADPWGNRLELIARS